MAFDIMAIKQVYEDEGLNFSTDEERQLIRFSMDTEAASDVRFIARIVNPRTALFTTILPVNIPENQRQAVSEYITRVNYVLLLGNFQMDFSDGELSYKAVGIFEEENGLLDEEVKRLSYVGFNMFDKYIPGVFAIIYGKKEAKEAFDEINDQDED